VKRHIKDLSIQAVSSVYLQGGNPTESGRFHTFIMIENSVNTEADVTALGPKGFHHLGSNAIAKTQTKSLHSFFK
jgi:hypothetical protein